MTLADNGLPATRFAFAAGDGTRISGLVLQAHEPAWGVSTPDAAGVQSVRVDDAFSQPFSVLLVHTNGFEHTVLRGAPRILANATSVVLAVLPATRARFEELAALLPGFRCRPEPPEAWDLGESSVQTLVATRE